MAGYGWNLTQFPKRQYNSSQIACRICSHVFMSTQALIEHIETHMVDDYSTSGRQSNGRNIISSQRNNPYNTIPSPPSSASSLPPNILAFGQTSYNLPSLQEIRNNPMLTPKPQTVPPRPAMHPQPPLPLLGTRKSQHPSIGSQLQISVALTQKKIRVEGQPAGDRTKPFIQQLDKPYSYKIEENGSSTDNKPDLDLLDLTLKL